VGGRERTIGSAFSLKSEKRKKKEGEGADRVVPSPKSLSLGKERRGVGDLAFWPSGFFISKKKKEKRKGEGHQLARRDHRIDQDAFCRKKGGRKGGPDSARGRSDRLFCLSHRRGKKRECHG